MELTPDVHLCLVNMAEFTIQSFQVIRQPFPSLLQNLQQR